MRDPDIKHSDYVTDYTFKKSADTKHNDYGIKRYDNDIKRDYGSSYGPKSDVTQYGKIDPERNNFGTDYDNVDTITGDSSDIYVSKDYDPGRAYYGKAGGSSDVLKHGDGKGSAGDYNETGNLMEGFDKEKTYSLYDNEGFSDVLSTDNVSDGIKHMSDTSKNGIDIIKKNDSVKKSSEKIAETTKDSAEKLKEAGEAAGEYTNPYGYIRKGIRYVRKARDKADESFSSMERGYGYDFTRNRRTLRVTSLNDLVDTDWLKKVLIIFVPLLLIAIFVYVIIISVLPINEQSTVIETGDPKRYIVRHLHNEGYSNYAIAAILGATQIESGVNPTRIEGDYIAEIDFPGREVYVSDKIKRYSYFWRYYAWCGGGLAVQYYYSSRGTDNIWLGTGMCQWTGERGENVVHYIGDGEFDYDNVTEGWDTVRHQMDYFDYEMDFDNEYPGAVTNYYNSICAYLGDDFKTAEPMSGESVNSFLDRLTRAYKIVHLAWPQYNPVAEVKEAQEYYPKIDDYLNSSDLIWPIPGCYNITSPFGPRIAPTPGASTYHMGIDISASDGTSVITSADGKVVFTGYNLLRGYYIKVEHGGNAEGMVITTLYQHLSTIEAETGDEVTQGEEIAKSGHSGIGTGPHLHFEVHEDGTPVDPLKYVSPE